MNNNYPITGVIYDIRKSEPIIGKKDVTQTYYKYYITLEVKSAGEKQQGDKTFYTTKTQFPPFEWFNPPAEIIENFNIGDLVCIDFYCSGQKFTYKKGDKAGQEGIMGSNMITRIRFADIDGGHSNHKGKITVDSMSDTKELESKVDAFPPPLEDDVYGDLPFIITALIGIGSLFIL